MESDREELFENFLDVKDDTFTFELVRGHIEEGLTFSPEAVSVLIDNMTAFVMSRIARRWGLTNEPPTTMMVKMSVEAR